MELPPLDCSAPRGDVRRIEAATVSAAAFCQELSALAGPPPATTTEGWRKQARHLRERLIDTELVRIALAQEGIVVEESAVEQAMAQARRPDSDAQPSDAEEAQLRAQVRARLERSRLLEARTSAAVTDEDLRAAYARDPARYGEPARATVTPFALRLSPSASDADIAQARQKAQQFRNEGAQGGAVAACVRTGLAALPAFEVEDGGIEPALAAVALRLGSGQWSEPVRARIGWVVMRVDEVRAAAVLPFEEVQGKVKAMLLGERRRDDEAVLRRDLRDDARIEDLVSF